MTGPIDRATASPYSFAPMEKGRAADARSETSPSNAAQKEEDELSPAEKQQVKELRQRDAQVRAHEMAHLAAAGGLAVSGPHYVFQTGPDGKNYAIGGDVKIDTSPGRTPEETLRKAAQVKAAALAPSDPSPQDLRVSAAASQLAAEATQKLDRKGKESEADATKTPSEPSEIDSARRLADTRPADEEPPVDGRVAGSAPRPLAARAAALYQAPQSRTEPSQHA